MKKLGQFSALCGFSILGLGLAGQASAGCFVGQNGASGVSPKDELAKLNAGARLTPAVFLPGRISAGFVPVHELDRRASIVGLWKFEMLAKSAPAHKNPMPDDALIDFGTAAWHDDGTELMNSGSRNPADGDFCQGVWEQIGSNEYALNHYALSWTNGTYTGPANIREIVKVDRTGRRFTGVFTLTQYLASTTPGHEFDQTTALVTITGNITGTRVTVY